MEHKLVHTIQRSGSFYYNRRVPGAVADRFGTKLVRVRLGSDPDEAAKLAKLLTNELDAIWAAPDVCPLDLQYLVERLRPKPMDLLRCTEEYLSLRSISERPVRLAVSALVKISGNKDIRTYKRSDAREVVGLLLRKGNKTATVRRRVQSLHAVFEYGLLETDCQQRNPFSRLSIPKEGGDTKKRKVFTASLLHGIYRDALQDKRDTRLVTPILGETGARLAEIIGLRWIDVDFANEKIRITPHKLRELKTINSERDIPITGVGLSAFQILWNNRSCDDFVFPRWKKEGGFVATHASNTINKFLRSHVGDRTCHCFRHTFRDRLRAVEAPADLIDQLGGWRSAGGVGVRYGTGYSLEHRRHWLQKIAIFPVTI